MIGMNKEELKEYQRNYQKEWHKTHPDYLQKWREEHPDYFRRWYQAHPEVGRNYARHYRETHQEEVRAYNATQNRLEANRHNRMVHGDKYRQHDRDAKRWMKRRAQLVGSFTKKQWLERLAEFNYHCAYCLEPITTYIVAEHMTPISRGGDNLITNIVPACAKCNNKKRTKTILEFISMRQEINKEVF